MKLAMALAWGVLHAEVDMERARVGVPQRRGGVFAHRIMMSLAMVPAGSSPAAQDDRGVVAGVEAAVEERPK